MLQTKDLGCTMGNWELGDELRGAPGRWGDPVPMPYSGILDIYTFCPACPAYLQPETWNVLEAWVQYEVELEDSRVVRVRRVSESFAEWTERMRSLGSVGPMSIEEAIEECRARWEGRRPKPD
jgi:hypothetical protein